MSASEWLQLLAGALLACFVLVVAMFVQRVVRYARRHRRLANRRFMRRYRATASATPLVRRPRLTGIGRDPAVPAAPPDNRRAA